MQTRQPLLGTHNPTPTLRRWHREPSPLRLPRKTLQPNAPPNQPRRAHSPHDRGITPPTDQNLSNEFNKVGLQASNSPSSPSKGRAGQVGKGSLPRLRRNHLWPLASVVSEGRASQTGQKQPENRDKTREKGAKTALSRFFVRGLHIERGRGIRFKPRFSSKRNSRAAL